MKPDFSEISIIFDICRKRNRSNVQRVIRQIQLSQGCDLRKPRRKRSQLIRLQDHCQLWFAKLLCWSRIHEQEGRWNQKKKKNFSSYQVNLGGNQTRWRRCQAWWDFSNLQCLLGETATCCGSNSAMWDWWIAQCSLGSPSKKIGLTWLIAGVKGVSLATFWDDSMPGPVLWDWQIFLRWNQRWNWDPRAKWGKVREREKIERREDGTKLKRERMKLNFR